MKNKILLIFIILIGLVACLFILRFVIGGPEDDWMCADGKWIKHGAPSAPMPDWECKL